MISWKDKALTEYKKELDATRQLLKEAKTDGDGKKYPYTLKEYKDIVAEKDATIADLKRQVEYLNEGISDYRRELHQIKANLN